jgi:hypothetical protein
MGGPAGALRTCDPAVGSGIDFTGHRARYPAMGVRTRGLDIKAGAAKLKADRAARLEAELVPSPWGNSSDRPLLPGADSAKNEAMGRFPGAARRSREFGAAADGRGRPVSPRNQSGSPFPSSSGSARR